MTKKRGWFTHSSRERHGIRWWLHVSRRVVGVEFYWWGARCHASVSTDDEGWNLAVAFPPVARYLSLEGFPLWQPTRTCVATWEQPPRPFVIPESRESRIAFHDWTLWVTPWGRSMEWRKADPWWVRGWSLNVRDLVLGRTRYTCQPLGPAVSALVPMPEGAYPATFSPQRQTWARPRWFSQVRESFNIDIPKGIPFAGKGENSYDCGDDWLFGMSAEGSLEQAIEAVRATVLKRRARYGEPSEQAVKDALLLTHLSSLRDTASAREAQP